MYRNKTAVKDEVPGGAFNPKTSMGQGRPSFLKMHAITKVTPEMIAYTAVQVCQSYLLDRCPDNSGLQTYVGLSSMGSWGDTDGTFNLIRFYHLIMKTLSDNADPWVTNTLDWWQK